MSRKQISCSSDVRGRRRACLAGRGRGRRARRSDCTSPSSTPKRVVRRLLAPTIASGTSRSARPDWPKHSSSSRRRLPDERRPPPVARPPAAGGALMPIGRILRAYANEVKYESLRMLRSPGVLDPVPAAAGAGLSVLRRHARGARGREESRQSRTISSRASRCSRSWGRRSSASAARSRVERDAGFLKLKRALPGAGRRVSHREDADGDGVRARWRWPAASPRRCSPATISLTIGAAR